jgi:hypothetical protein
MSWFGLERKGLSCLLITGLGIPGFIAHPLITCMVGIDGSISLLAPIKYRTFGKRYAKYTLALGTVFVLGFTTIGVGLSTLNETIPCINCMDTFGEAFNYTYRCHAVRS